MKIKRRDKNKIKRKRQNENKNVMQVGEKLFNVKTYARCHEYMHMLRMHVNARRIDVKKRRGHSYNRKGRRTEKRDSVGGCGGAYMLVCHTTIVAVFLKIVFVLKKRPK